MKWLPHLVVGLSLAAAGSSVMYGLNRQLAVEKARRDIDALHQRLLDQQDELLAISAAKGECADLLTQCTAVVRQFAEGIQKDTHGKATE